MSFILEEEGTALRAESSLLCLPKVHSALLRLGRPVNTCGQDDGEDADDLDEGDGGDLAHGDVKRGELAQGEEGGEAGVIPSQPCLANSLCCMKTRCSVRYSKYCLENWFATCLADQGGRA